MCRGTKHLPAPVTDLSDSYNLTTIELLTTIPVHLHLLLGGVGVAPMNTFISNLLFPVNQKRKKKKNRILSLLHAPSKPCAYLVCINVLGAK